LLALQRTRQFPQGGDVGPPLSQGDTSGPANATLRGPGAMGSCAHALADQVPLLGDDSKHVEQKPAWTGRCVDGLVDAG
jgi:hypothetical protein